MAVKVLVSAIGQQLIAETKQIENKETGDIVGYWLSNPRVVVYNRNPDTNDVTIGFGAYCLVSDEQEFSVKADHIVSILEPRDDVASKYQEVVFPQQEDGSIEVTNESDSVGGAEDGSSADITD